jgi:hypothetical protein
MNMPITTEDKPVATTPKKVPTLLAALRLLYEETADYIRLNHLGDVHHNRSMQFARDALAATTPAAEWRDDGEPDPHGERYSGERAGLCMGNLTDDELANGVFLHGDGTHGRAPIADVVAGRAFWPIAWLTAAKDRIRWLSRRVEAQDAARAQEVEAAYRRGVQDGGRIVFSAVMEDDSNRNRGVDLYHRLHAVAVNALAEKVIAEDPDQQPLWEHLIDEAFTDYRARHQGFLPYPEAGTGQKAAFTSAVRSMLLKKLPAPDSENMQLREALCLVRSVVGSHSMTPTDPLVELLKVPAAVRDAALAAKPIAELTGDDAIVFARESGMEEASSRNIFYAGVDDLIRFARLARGSAATVDAPCHKYGSNPGCKCGVRCARDEAAAGVAAAAQGAGHVD